MDGYRRQSAIDAKREFWAYVEQWEQEKEQAAHDQAMEESLLDYHDQPF